MPQPPESKREEISTYFVQDRSNQEELLRIEEQGHLLTAGMGGALSEQADPTLFQRVLDVGCGTGGWLIELAKTMPNCKRLVGIDASRTYIGYARTQAEVAGVSDRIEFQVMDALRMLEFPDDSFDLVSHRFASSWVRTWDWPKLLQEYQRVCRPDGVVRITEPSGMTVNSPALSQLNALFFQAFYHAGNCFAPTYEGGVTSELPRLFEQHGIREVQTHSHALHYRAGTPECQAFIDDHRFGFRTTLPFLRKWTRVPDNYEELYQQMLHEMQQPDFMATWRLLTIWGRV